MLVRARLSIAAVLAAVLAAPAFALPNFIEFESGQVRPLAMSPNGTRLFAVNTPDNTLEIFTIGAAGIAKTACWRCPPRKRRSRPVEGPCPR